MGDSYDAAQQQLNNQRAAILAAMAANGTQGKNYYDATQADLAAQRSAAVAQALQEAQNRGAPANMLASIQSQVEAPFSRASTNVNNGAIAEQTWRNNLGDATANYMDQQIAAIPGLRIIAQTKAAADKAKADLQAAKDAASLARANSSKAKGGGTGLTDSELRTRLSGAGQVAKQSVLDAANSLPDIPGLTSGLKALLIQGAGAPSDQEYARGQGVAAGLDPNLVYGLLPDKTGSTKAVGPSSPTYHNAANAWQGAGPKATAVLRQVTNTNKTYQDALADLTNGAPSYWSVNGKSLTGGTSLDLEQMAAWLRAYYGLA